MTRSYLEIVDVAKTQSDTPWRSVKVVRMDRNGFRDGGNETFRRRGIWPTFDSIRRDRSWSFLGGYDAQRVYKYWHHLNHQCLVTLWCQWWRCPGGSSVQRHSFLRLRKYRHAAQRSAEASRHSYYVKLESLLGEAGGCTDAGANRHGAAAWSVRACGGRSPYSPRIAGHGNSSNAVRIQFLSSKPV